MGNYRACVNRRPFGGSRPIAFTGHTAYDACNHVRPASRNDYSHARAGSELSGGTNIQGPPLPNHGIIRSPPCCYGFESGEGFWNIRNFSITFITNSMLSSELECKSNTINFSQFLIPLSLTMGMDTALLKSPFSLTKRKKDTILAF